MERKAYLERCRQFALLPKGVHGQPMGGGEHIQARVLRYGKPYYAKSYLLDYDKDGKPRHAAIIRETDCNCVIQCPLSVLAEPSMT